MNFYFFSSAKSLRAALAAIIILTLVIRGFIPIGFMPDTKGPAGQPVAITICDGIGPMHMAGMTMPADPVAPKQNDGTQKFQDHAPCPFSVGAVFAATDNVPQFAVPYAAFVILSMLAGFALMRQSRFGNASPRAPPLFS